MAGQDLFDELSSAVIRSRAYGINLFVNDFWQEAIALGAFGVHLGQEDLNGANLKELMHSNLRVGISTHNWSEVARAIAIDPAYIAIGPIFNTDSKQMNSLPQGLEGFKYWRSILSFPLVAIGGIKLSEADSLIKAGADGIAMISDISDAEFPGERAREWALKFEKHSALKTRLAI